MLAPRAIRITAILVIAGCMAGPAAAVELVSSHNDWKAYRHGEGRELMCFAVSPAKEQQPSGGKRQEPHLYVTAWPKQGIKSEVSVLLGFDVRRGSEITVDIGGATFTLIPDGDRGYVGNARDEERLLEAMRRGTRMTVEATPDAGGSSKDTFSLSGVTAAVQAMAAGCS